MKTKYALDVVGVVHLVHPRRDDWLICGGRIRSHEPILDGVVIEKVFSAQDIPDDGWKTYQLSCPHCLNIIAIIQNLPVSVVELSRISDAYKALRR